MTEAKPVIVREGGAGPSSWEEGLSDAQPLLIVDGRSPDDLSSIHDVDCVLVDGRADAIGLARRAHSADPTVQVIVVAPGEERKRIERAVLFGRGLGEVWIVGPDEVGSDLVERATAVTRQRRSYRTTTAAIDHDLASMAPRPARRAIISDAYLASLLTVLPDPVISLDPEGRVLSWNAAADRVIGYRRFEALGRALHEVLRPLNETELAALLEQDAEKPVKDEIRFQRRDGEVAIAEIAVVLVEAADHRIRAVVLHDLTEERQIQDILQEKAMELEAQASELEAAQLELELANDDLQRINDELALRTREAEQARHDADAANRAKSDFLATMSHEIRTPINAIIGYTELLEMGLAGGLTEQQAVQLGRVRASSRHLLSLIEDILDLAKVEAGRIEVAQERALVVSSIAAALALVVPQSAEKGIRIEDPCNEDSSTYYVGDESRVRQILVNLLSNAIKFTDPGGVIRVTCGTTERPPDGADEADGPRAFIRVIDTGIGIPQDEMDRIFRPFEQVEKGHTRVQGGTGLGLTISRRLARLMGGDLTAESQQGVGSTFTLWLPTRAAPAEGMAEAVLAEMRQNRPRGLGEVGRALAEQADTIVRDYRDRLRADTALAMAAEIEDADLEDHAPALLADIAQNLLAMEKSAEVPERLLRDGGEIQRVIAELHGGQRVRLGWSEAAMRTELAILRQEVEAGVRRRLSGSEFDRALALLTRFLDQAERASLAGFRRASLEDPA
ncbi:MAG: ATP-binding protein [Gemmatimonadota bacterium]